MAKNNFQAKLKSFPYNILRKQNKNNIVLNSCLLGSIGILMFCGPSVAAPKNAEIVVDATTGEVLYEDNATAKRYPASITKVMTLYMLFEAIEDGKIKLDDNIYFSKNASNQKPTKLGVKSGNSISVETAIQALIIKSANDVAVAVAEHIAGNEGEFAKLMTDKAHQIGMINTNFANASGLPNANQISTAEDLSKLAIAIRRDFPQHYHWFGRENFTYNGVQMNNHNHLVGKVDGVDGLKTGFTSASGYNLATTSVRDGKMIVTVVMGGKTWRSRDTRVAELIETAYAQSGIKSASVQYHNPYQYSYDNYRDNIDMQSLLVDASFGKPINQYSGTQLVEEKPTLKFNKPFVVAIKDGSNKDISIDDNAKNEDEAEEENIATNIADKKSAIITTSFDVPTFTLKGKIDEEQNISDAKDKVELAEIPNFELPSTSQSDEIPADLAKIIADEENEKLAQKARMAKIQAQKREDERSAAKKSAEIAKQLADKKAKDERAIAAKLEKERQLAVLNHRGNVIVQVGAFKAKDDAQAAIVKLAKNFPKIAKSEVSSTKTSTGIWFRARFSGIAVDSAKQACNIVVKTGAVCQIITK